MDFSAECAPCLLRRILFQTRLVDPSREEGVMSSCLRLVAEGWPVFGFPMPPDAYLIDFGTPEKYARAQAEWPRTAVYRIDVHAFGEKYPDGRHIATALARVFRVGTPWVVPDAAPVADAAEAAPVAEQGAVAAPSGR